MYGYIVQIEIRAGILRRIHPDREPAGGIHLEFAGDPGPSRAVDPQLPYCALRIGPTGLSPDQLDFRRIARAAGIALEPCGEHIGLSSRPIFPQIGDRRLPTGTRVFWIFLNKMNRSRIRVSLALQRQIAHAVHVRILIKPRIVPIRH